MFESRKVEIERRTNLQKRPKSRRMVESSKAKRDVEAIRRPKVEEIDTTDCRRKVDGIVTDRRPDQLIDLGADTIVQGIFSYYP